MTPFELSLENDLNIEWQRFANDWLFKWHALTYEHGKVDVEDFRGGRIRYGGGMKFDYQKQQIFWQAIERYLISKVHEIFKRWDTETAQYSTKVRIDSIHGVAAQLQQFVHQIMQRSRDTAERIQGHGTNQAIEAFDPIKHMNPAQAEIGRVAHTYKSLLETTASQSEASLIWKRLEDL